MRLRDYQEQAAAAVQRAWADCRDNEKEDQN